MQRKTHISSRQTIVSWVIGVSTVLAVLFAGTTQATATTTDYIAGNGGTFATSAGGWSNQSVYAGVCLPITQGLTCPAMSGTFQANGGFGGAGDGFIRTSENGTSLAALLATSSSIWKSPEFTYDGAGGGTTPASLEFSLKKRSDMGDLLAVGADATYKVDAVNKSGGKDVTLVEPTTVGTNTAWASAPNVALSKTALVVGNKYQFVITTTVGGLAAVLPAGHVDFDNATLTATSATGGTGGGGIGGGTDGPGGGGTTGTEVAPPKVIPAGVAYLYKGKLFVRAKCPKAFKPKCKVKGTASTKKKGKALTKVMKATIKSKKFKRVTLKVKPKSLTKVTKLAASKKKTIWLTMKVKSKAGKKKGTVREHLRVIHPLK